MGKTKQFWTLSLRMLIDPGLMPDRGRNGSATLSRPPLTAILEIGEAACVGGWP